MGWEPIWSHGRAINCNQMVPGSYLIFNYHLMAMQWPRHGWMGDQKGKHIMRFLVVCVFMGSYGFDYSLTIPKWRINDSGPIAILFKWFFELCKYRPNLDPRTPCLSQNYLKNTKYKDICENIILGNMRNANLENVGRCVYLTFYLCQIRLLSFRTCEFWMYDTLKS